MKLKAVKLKVVANAVGDNADEIIEFDPWHNIFCSTWVPIRFIISGEVVFRIQEEVERIVNET